MAQVSFPDSNNWQRSDYIALVHASVSGKFNPAHWLQYATIESGLAAKRPIPLLRAGSGPFAYNKSGGAAGLFQAMPDIQKALGFTPGTKDFEDAKGDFREVSISGQINYSKKYLEEWRVRYRLPQWDSAGTMYLCNFWPAGVPHRDEPGYVLVDSKKLPKTYAVNSGLDSQKKGFISVLDMVVAANRALGLSVYQTAMRSLISLAQNVVQADGDGIKGPLTDKALEKYTGSRQLDIRAWATLAPSLQ